MDYFNLALELSREQARRVTEPSVQRCEVSVDPPIDSPFESGYSCGDSDICEGCGKCVEHCDGDHEAQTL